MRYSREMGFKRANSKYKDVYDAIRSDDWRKLIGFMESSPTMIRIICDAKPKEPLINTLIAYDRIDLVFDVIDELEPEDLEAKDFNGDTGLHVAASQGHIEIARALLDKNIRLVHSINSEGEIPLLKAALNGKREIFWKLFRMGSRIKSRRSDGATALHCAVLANHFELAYEIVVENPELIMLRDQLGLTVLHYMVSIPDAFRSGCRLSPLDALLYKCVIVEKSASQASTKKEAEEEDHEHLSDDDHHEHLSDDDHHEHLSDDDDHEHLIGSGESGDLEYIDPSVDSIVPSELSELPRQRIPKHEEAPKSGDDRDITGDLRRSNVNNNKNLYTTLVRWTQRLVNKIKTIEVIQSEKTSKRKSNEGKRPQLNADEGDEEDPRPVGYDQVGYLRPGMKQSHSKKFRLLELHDEADQPNGFIKLFKPYERWIRRMINYVMVLTHYKKELIDLKKKHKDAKRLLSFIAKNQEYWWSLSRGSIPESHLVSDQKHDKMMERWMETPLTLGAIMGLDELVKRIIKKHPAAASFVGKEGKNLFHVAVENRREYIVNLLEWMKKIDPRLPDRMISSRDNNGNTILHLAAMPNNQQGSPMQMLEEFKWFEKVKEIVPKDLVNHRNKEGKTAKEVFTESHVSMIEDAKTQLTNTARSCCAALVSAVMFAAGFSIANGNEKKGKEGTRSSKIAYKIFSHTYIFGLSCTAMALVQFMALLMASYKEEDFRRSLPTQYVLALASLFTAMFAMLAAFACNTYISLYDQLKLDWTNYLPVIAEIFLLPLICLIILRWRGVNFPFFSAFRAFLG